MRATAIFLGLGLLMAGGSTALAQQWAYDMFPVKTHNFGKVPSNSTAEFAFEFTNNYKETVHVSSVRSTCGCTLPSIAEPTIKSRETGRVLATFNTKSFVGYRAATITVEFDKPFHAEVQLMVSGEILTDVTIDPAEVGFGQVTAGEEKSTEIRVSFLNRPNIKITDIRSLFSDLKVKLGEPTRSGNRTDYKLVASLKETAKPGEIGEILTLVTNDPTYQTVVVSVTGRVRPPIEVKPDTVHFESARVGSELSERLLIRADKPFSISSVACEDPRFTFEIPEGSKNIHFVKLKFTPAIESIGEFKVPLKVMTDLGESVYGTCTVTGRVVEAD